MDSQLFYLNYYSISTLAIGIFTLITALGFFFARGKSPVIGKLVFLCLSISAIGFGYGFSQGMVEKIVIPRIFLLSAMILVYVGLLAFYKNFPNQNFRKFPGVLFILQILSIFIGMGLFTYKILQRPVFFDFTGHSMDFEAPSEFKLFILILLFSIIIIYSLIIYKLIKDDKIYRLLHLGMMLSIAGFTLIPTVAYAIHKSGGIDRGEFFNIFFNFCILGFFGVIVLFLNYTTDKTSFLFKVLGISFLSFMLIFNGILYSQNKRIEETYDMKKQSDIELAILGKKNLADLSYIIKKGRLTVESAQFFNLYSDAEKEKYKEEVNLPLSFALLGNFILNGKGLEEFKEYSFPVAEEADTSYHQYQEWKKDRKYKTESEILQKYNKELYKLSIGIKNIPSEKFKEEFIKFKLQKLASMKVFDTKLNEIVNKTDFSGSDLKLKVLNYFLPVEFPNIRSYRSDSKGNRYLIYHYINSEEKIAAEIAFDYVQYRAYIHNYISDLFGYLGIGIILILVGTPVFLSRALLLPLNKLLEGVGKVREGDLNVKIPASVNDEIGYITNSFNEMVDSIRDAEHKLKDYADHLEEKVIERTRELKETLHQVELLKEQQDGDYFLTTLLLKPFEVNTTRNSKIKVNFFIKQKKEFTFKKKTHQIGGDLCISHSIELRGKRYIVFLNADAMGKSIQGAGGILVLGSVFQSLIQRTRAYKTYSEIAPESWITTAFKELHKTFETFEGSMLISLIFGLVEESTGLVYYINAEHPWLILYRDGKASFANQTTSFRKLGHEGAEGDLSISMIQMLPEDMLIMGSDGKDDIVLSKEEGRRVINEDEELFLQSVEDSKGDLDSIYNAISSKYELIDDFSVLSIKYPLETAFTYTIEELKEIEETIISAKDAFTNRQSRKAIGILSSAYGRFNKSKDIAELLVKMYMKKKRYEEAMKLCKEYLKENEVNTNMLFRASICYKKNREFGEAINLAERIRLREPKNTRNLVHLADMYAFTNNIYRAHKILNKVFAQEPKNPSALKILKIVEEKSLLQGK